MLLLVLLAACVSGYVLSLLVRSRSSWKDAHTISEALEGAKSVSLVEFYRGIAGPELALDRKKASARQIADLRSAVGGWFAPSPFGMAMCFEPHHRVEIVRADGSMFCFTICFECRNYALVSGADPSVRVGATNGSLPTPWVYSLSRFFSLAGMPPREDYRELVKKHPDYHLIEEAEAEFYKQAKK